MSLTGCRVIVPDLRYEPLRIGRYYFPNYENSKDTIITYNLNYGNPRNLNMPYDSLNRFTNKWYSKHLFSLGEPILYDKAIKNYEIIRYTNLGTWSHPFTFRVERKDSKIIGVVGAGTQARMQILALLEVFSLKEIKVWDINTTWRDRYVEEMSEQLKIPIEPVEHIKDAVIEADIIVTVTPSRKALVMKEWIQEGVHINAIGADGPGKQELDPFIVKRADKVVVDSLNQCRIIGEIQHALADGLIIEDDVYAEIGQILIGEKKGRETNEEITLFDATGLAAQDIAAANIVFKQAKEKGIGRVVFLLDK